jgi:hypothetical protein
MLLIVFVSASLYSQKGQPPAGVVDKIVKQEIYIKYSDINKPFSPGEKLHFFSGTESVTVEVVFPMQTFARCRLTSKNTDIFSSLKKGVFAYREDASSDYTKQFRDNGDGTISDVRSGLMWLKNTDYSAEMNYKDAVNYCKNFKAAGYSDWRLPQKSEIEAMEISSYVDWNAYLITCGFSRIPPHFWTSSKVTNPSGVDIVSLFFLNPGHCFSAPTGYRSYVWPVRSTK